MNKIRILGDIHDNKATCLIKRNGIECIYKPRSGKTEICFKAFLCRLKEEGFLYLPGVVEIMEETETSHIEAVVNHVPVMKENEVHLYFKRAGVLLFFAYLFSSVDLHCENIVANGEYPTIVDYETLLTGELQHSSLIKGSLVESVLSTHLLSNWGRRNGEDIDFGGLTGKSSHNVLFYGDKPVEIWRYEKDVLYGYNYASNFSIKRKVLITELTRLFDDCAFRVLLRPTSLYESLGELIKLVMPNEREMYAKALLLQAYKDKQKGYNRKIIETEMASVMLGQVPYFFVYGKGTKLYSRKGIVDGAFLKKSPVEKALEKISALNGENTKSNLRIISQAIRATKPYKGHNSQVSSSITVKDDIANKLEQNYIKTIASGWMYLTRMPDATLSFLSIGFGLYDGLLGILCYYAALYNKTGNKEYLTKIQKGYTKFKHYSYIEKCRMSPENCSVMKGIGGMILALHHIYDLTGVKYFQEEVEYLAGIALEQLSEMDFRTEEKIVQKSEDCDVLCGYAGMAIALPYISIGYARELAAILINILLRNKPKMTGYAHGAAGFALAIGIIGRILGVSDYDDEIIALLKWEDESYDPLDKNWYDLIEGRKKKMFGWCAGAPGIGMARLRLHDMTNNQDIQNICIGDIERVKNHLKTMKLLDRDCLCCGNAARLMAASKLGVCQEELYNILLDKTRKNSINIYHVSNTCDFVPGLMQGYAGIGYALTMNGDNRSGDMLV